MTMSSDSGDDIGRDNPQDATEGGPLAPGGATLERRPVFSAIRWGAVFAGVVVGISVQLVLILLGIAIGVTAAGDDLKGLSGLAELAPLAWAGVSMLISAFFSGYVAARMSGLKRRADGVLHGAVTWAVTTILFAVLATSIGGTLLSGVFNNMSQLAQANATASGESPLAVLMRSQGITVDGKVIRELQQHLRAGERTRAVEFTVEAMGVERERAENIVDQALILTGSPEAASPEGRASTGNAMQSAGAAAWTLFLTVALALAIGIGGGTVGVVGSRREGWSGAQPAH